MSKKAKSGSGASLPSETGVAERVAALLERMSLEEKSLLLSGDGWWRTYSIERLGIPAIALSDGPHGLRITEGSGSGRSVPATCFPTAPGLAATWNLDLVKEVGAALGREAQASDVQFLLGPGANMKRSPLGGRNFEYFSEDPLLTGTMATAYIDGVQDEGVGTSLKHFAVNNQEFERMATSSNLDERTLHEIYLPAFEIAVTQAQPWTVMSAYNLVNGCYASEHAELLTRILRDAWGFNGFVVSDWGAINDRVQGVIAGTNLEMPGSGDYNRQKIIAAVQNGTLSMEALDRSVRQLLAVVLKAWAMRKPGATFDAEAHHTLARRAAGESIVLLKNAGNILPLNVATIAVIGAFARNPRYQGAGSSQVNPTRVSNAYDELAALIGADIELSYAPGYDVEGNATDEQIAEACQTAKRAGVAVVFAGLPDSYESEGFDRASLDLPIGHNRLIDAVSVAQPNIVVVLMNGSAVTMPWVSKVKGIVESWLGGQAGGGAVADVLTGSVNPSGKLSETFPVNLEQTPAYPNFPARHGQAEYGEGLFIGYRHYDKKRIAPLFPFGFGLSYTNFAYTGIHAGSTRYDADADGEFTVDVKVKNVGAVAGKEVVQLYIHERRPCVVRPDRELKAFSKVTLEPGEEQTVHFLLSRRDFAYYNPAVHAWEVNSGTFDVLAGSSSRDLPLQATVEVHATKRAIRPLTRQSLIKDFLDHPQGHRFYEELVKAMGFTDLLTSTGDAATDGLTYEQITARQKAHAAELAFVNDMPLNKIPAFSCGAFTEARLNEILLAVEDRTI